MELQQYIHDDIRLALAEDIGNGDISAMLIEESKRLAMHLLVRDDAVLCGTAWFDETFRQCADTTQFNWLAKDGDRVSADSLLCEISGPARGLLSAERTALNYLQTLSGTATITSRYADCIQHTNCRILDTRKTIPHLRRAQKYAVLCGGGLNHRIGLFDAYLIKENHLAASGGIKAAVERALCRLPSGSAKTRPSTAHRSTSWGSWTAPSLSPPPTPNSTSRPPSGTASPSRPSRFLRPCTPSTPTQSG